MVLVVAARDRKAVSIMISFKLTGVGACGTQSLAVDHDAGDLTLTPIGHCHVLVASLCCPCQRRICKFESHTLEPSEFNTAGFDLRQRLRAAHESTEARLRARFSDIIRLSCHPSPTSQTQVLEVLVMTAPGLLMTGP